METQDIRWKQRFANYQKALAQLIEFVERTPLNKFEEQGFIKSFEYTYELGWNVMKDYFEYQGDVKIMGSRDAIQIAYSRGLVEDGKRWMEMIEDRIKSSHTYDQAMADDVAQKIITLYFSLFLSFEDKMKSLL